MNQTEPIRKTGKIGLIAALGLIVMLAVAQHPMVLGFGFGLIIFMLGVIAERLEWIEQRMSKK